MAVLLVPPLREARRIDSELGGALRRGAQLGA
jgi:hypothetical protein